MRKIGSIFILLILAACTQPEEELIDISEITPQSKKDYDKVDDPAEVEDSTIEIKNRFINNGISVDSINFSEKKLFPDRVGPTSCEKYTLNSGVEYVEYYSWIYSDSAKTMNAFYNWIDFFGVEMLGDEVNFQKEPMCILVGDTSLIFISGSTLKINKWVDYHKNLGYEEEWNYLVQQKLGARSRWFTFVDGKKEAFKQPSL